VSDDTARLAADALARGTTTFLDLTFEVAPGALVPRPETELLARIAIASLRSREGAPTVIDMGCGSGNLACAIALALPTAKVFASDIAAAAVEVTRRNAARLGVADRVAAFEGDLFAALPDNLRGNVDAVVANPPYISTGKLDSERAELLAHEPREAFDAGPYGLTLHQRIVADALGYLRPGGLLACEFGLGQERQLRIVVERSRGYHGLAFHQNDAGAPRALTAQRLNPGAP
jgi:release factor glutamine methyltransferase